MAQPYSHAVGGCEEGIVWIVLDTEQLAVWMGWYNAANLHHIIWSCCFVGLTACNDVKTASG